MAPTNVAPAEGRARLKPVLAGSIVGILEISATYPLEFVKRTLQLQQRASPLSRASAVCFAGPLQCVLHTVRAHGPFGLYTGFSSFVVFAGPKSAIRWGTFEALSSTTKTWPPVQKQPVARVEAACGFGAGMAEATLGQTPNQAISTKMLHDASPAGPQRLHGLAHAVRTYMYKDVCACVCVCACVYIYIYIYIYI